MESLPQKWCIQVPGCLGHQWWWDEAWPFRALFLVLMMLLPSAMMEKWYTNLIYRFVCVPALTSHHEIWIMTERTRSHIQAAEINFLHRVAGLSLRERVRNSVIQGKLELESCSFALKGVSWGGLDIWHSTSGCRVAFMTWQWKICKQWKWRGKISLC